MFTIGSIQWPKDTSSAIHLYLNFLLLVLETLKIDFSGYNTDPVQITKLFLDDLTSEDERRHALEAWWDYIDSQGAIREFQDKNILMGRLAICLLSVTEKDVNQLGEHLSWFLEVLGFLGADTKKAIQMMIVYFKPKD